MCNTGEYTQNTWQIHFNLTFQLVDGTERLPNPLSPRKARVDGKIDIVTRVHVNMTARASLLDISVQFRDVADDAPEALARVHFVRITDTKGQVRVLL